MGSATVELVLLAPLLVSVVWLMIFCGRMTDSRLLVEDVAHQAARAASSARSVADANVEARTTAREAVRDAGITCGSLAVDVAGSVQPGGTVEVTVTCHVALSDLALLEVPGAATLSGTFSSPVDVYRGTTNTTKVKEATADETPM
ncbi:TadE family protein [Streptomyces sp. NPDC058469]|uniref:TadE family protein n=1 Tax=Streptomyces sp. NPDC058469 TaxID=3346514 RepID=UPI0036509F37